MPEEPLAVDSPVKLENDKIEEPKAKPELATFRLKRGKANMAEKPREFKPREKKFENKDKKPFSERKKDDKKFSKDKKSGKPKREERDHKDEDRIYSSQPQKFEDSPFAILQNLKLGNEKKS